MKQICYRFKFEQKNIHIVAINRPISKKKNTPGCTSVTPPKCGATGSVHPDIWTHLQYCKQENVSTLFSHFL